MSSLPCLARRLSRRHTHPPDKGRGRGVEGGECQFRGCQGSPGRHCRSHLPVEGWWWAARGRGPRKGSAHVCSRRCGRAGCRDSARCSPRWGGGAGAISLSCRAAQEMNNAFPILRGRKLRWQLRRPLAPPQPTLPQGGVGVRRVTCARLPGVASGSSW